MRSLALRAITAVITCFVGIGIYLAWLGYRPTTEVAPLNTQLELPNPIPFTAPASDTKSVKEEWEELVKLEGCTLGNRYYNTQFHKFDPDKVNLGEAGIFYGKRWVAFFRRDKKETVPFLISLIPSKARTNVHIDPFRNAVKGELAVYCLQYILEVNWYELKDSYRISFDRIDSQSTTDQDLLQRIIRTKKGSQEMMDLWRKVNERVP